jgi:hypothetical protein
MANFYFLGTGSLYSTAASWSATDGGAAGSTIPGAFDDIFFTPSSAATCIIDIPATIRGLISSRRGDIHGLIRSATAGVKVNLTVTGNCNIGYMDFTDINASGGRTLYSFNGVITSCINIVSMTDKIVSADNTVESSLMTG